MNLGRSVPEWIGKSPDATIPLRVRIRVFEREGGCCHKCTRKINVGDKWTLEHLVALINGGQNRENNLTVTCDWCLKEKNREDAAIKKKGARIRAKHFGAKQPKRKIQSRNTFQRHESNSVDINGDRP